MKSFDTQSAEIQCEPGQVFSYIANPENLPEWTHGFKSVSGGTAVMETPPKHVIQNLTVALKSPNGTHRPKRSCKGEPLSQYDKA